MRMKARYRLIRRGIRNGYYCVDTQTRKRTSLGTNDEDSARQVVEAKNLAERQPMLNRQIAKAYLAGSDSAIATRTWQQAVEAVIGMKEGNTQVRWMTATKDKALRVLLPQVIIETQGETLLSVLRAGTVSTNVFLRRLHNFCVDMNWLPWPLVPKRQWPAVRYREKRAITWEEHGRIIEREKNPERKAFYQLAWHLGASQSDLANLHAEDVDWDAHVISFFRMKTHWRGQQPPQIRFGKEVEEILAPLPKTGALFPYLKTVRAGERATEFKQRCRGLGIPEITLHPYRYAWAERAKQCGYPERFAQLALGHNSKAVHRAYAKKAQVTLPPLEEFERLQNERKVITLNGQRAPAAVDALPEPQAAECVNA
jgi:integrase